jgi:hypothetical protein
MIWMSISHDSSTTGRQIAGVKVESRGDFNAIIEGHSSAHMQLLLLLLKCTTVIIGLDNLVNAVTGQETGQLRCDCRHTHKCLLRNSASNQWISGFIRQEKCGSSVKLVTHFYLVPRLWMHGAIPLVYCHLCFSDIILTKHKENLAHTFAVIRCLFLLCFISC